MTSFVKREIDSMLRHSSTKLLFITRQESATLRVDVLKGVVGKRKGCINSLCYACHNFWQHKVMHSRYLTYIPIQVSGPVVPMGVPMSNLTNLRFKHFSYLHRQQCRFFMFFQPLSLLL